MQSLVQLLDSRWNILLLVGWIVLGILIELALGIFVGKSLKHAPCDPDWSRDQN